MNILNVGNITSLTEANSVTATLPVAAYDLQMHPMKRFQLHNRPAFVMPNKIYGDVDTFAIRVIKTFSAMNKGISVLLSGPKGSGKTLTAKEICILSGMPVICITQSFTGGAFNAFLTDIPCPCVIFIDEFEKIYHDEDEKNQMLTLLDGTASNKHLFLLTSNNPDIGEYFDNRPGRVRYHKKYDEFSIDALKEMANDLKTTKKIKNSLLSFIDKRGSMSPDVFSCVAQECIIHNEPPEAFLQFFNIGNSLEGYFSVKFARKGFSILPGLDSKQTKIAQKFIRESANYGERYVKNNYKDWESLVKESEEIWEAPYCEIFRDWDDDRKIRLNYLMLKEPRAITTHSFEIYENEIKGFTRKNGEIIITLNNSDVIYAKKKKQKLSFYNHVSHSQIFGRCAIRGHAIRIKTASS